MRFSELIGRKIICLSLAKELGIVFNCNVDKKLKRINQLIAVDREEDEGYVDFHKINVGVDTLFTSYSLADYTPCGIAFPFRAPIFDTDGNGLGRVEDFEFENNQITDLVIGDNQTIASSRVVIASEELIIVKGQRKIKARLNETKPLVDEKTYFNETPLPSALPTVSMVIDPKTQVESAENEDRESPRKIISGYKFLLGRTVIKHILSGGKMIIPRGKVIDDDTVELARKYGKLVELTVSSVKDKSDSAE